MNTINKFAQVYMASKVNAQKWYELEAGSEVKWLLEAERQIKAIDGINLPLVYDEDIKSAICEVTLELLNNTDNAIFESYKKAGVTSISYGNDSVSFGQSTAFCSNSNINDYAYSLLSKYIQRSFPIV